MSVRFVAWAPVGTPICFENSPFLDRASFRSRRPGSARSSTLAGGLPGDRAVRADHDPASDPSLSGSHAYVTLGDCCPLCQPSTSITASRMSGNCGGGRDRMETHRFRSASSSSQSRCPHPTLDAGGGPERYCYGA